MSAAADPFVITSRERAKYVEQFKSLKPQNDFVTGQQARGFFLQSQLPPIVLGEIWGLADTDSDGKMNINEFSIACKLINLKLRGFEVPKALPPTLIASLTAISGTPILTPTGSLSPATSIPAALNTASHGPPGRPVLPQQLQQQMQQLAHQQLPPQQQSLIGGIGIAPQAPVMQPMAGAIPPMHPASIIPNVQAQVPIAPVAAPIIPIQPLINSVSAAPVAATAPIPPLIPPQPAIVPASNSALLMDSLINIGSAPPASVENSIISVAPVTAQATAPLPAPPTPPSGTQSRSMSISEKVPSVESPGSQTGSGVEWAVKGPAKLKYTQLFNTTDRTRSGFLTGAQARNILVQSKLPQGILANIWTLSDMDSDGRLGCEEFVLAMYLCDLAIQGEPIPAQLPPDLVPPSFRKGASSRHGSVASVGSAHTSRHGSVSSQSGAAPAPDASLMGIHQASFEDKRKENFDKGQAVLERKRKELLDQQRKEQEERERKEREEAEKREKARLEIERRQQEELERQLQIQRELEQQKEEQRKREIEQKEAARKEMEKQRQIEWENQRIAEMQQQRQREQEKVLKLKAQNQTHTIELESLNEKVKELSQKICDTRVAVTSVKTVIDGMRSTRDQQMSEMASLKARIKEQNAKLVHLSQEKTKLDSKSAKDGLSQEVFTNKQMNINQLRGKVQSIKEEVDPKQTDVNANTEQLTDLKSQLKNLLDNCEEIYALYDSHRNQVLELKNNKKNDSLTSAWDTPATQAWGTETTTATTTLQSTAIPPAKPGYEPYRAIYEFTARNTDEITFVPGDIVMVPFEQNAEPGWLAGEINGHTGWFPESYVEKIDDGSAATEEIAPSYPASDLTTEPVASTEIENVPSEVIGEIYISCYPYESGEVGDLTFAAGEVITIIKKEGDWWTGTIGDRTGIFPSNYVQEHDSTTTAGTNDDPSLYYQSTQQSNNYSDDVRNQEEADTEVSEINTQPKNESVQDNYSRPMSTSSTTSGIRGSKKGEVAQVIAAYEATSAEQLSLQRGQLIMIRKKTDSGWWEGELQARGKRRQIGWFPATYVKVLQSGRLSGRSTPVSGGKIQMTETILDKVIALYPYKAQNDDELSFEKDDIISVLGRDEPEWWRGECQGLTGLFPSNYVGSLVSNKCKLLIE